MGLENPGAFDVVTHTFFFRLMGPIYKKYIRSLGLQGNEKILEFGCGSGEASHYLAALLLKAGGHLTCLDISETWIKAVKKRLKKYPNIDFMTGDILKLPFDRTSYDGVFIHYVLHDIDPRLRPQVTRSLVALLKNGGKIFIREPNKARHGMPPDEIKKLMSDCGLIEIRGITEKNFFLGTFFTGIFNKP